MALPRKGPSGNGDSHERGFARSKGLFHVVDYAPPPEALTDEHPFALIAGMFAFQYKSATMARLCRALEKEADRIFVERKHAGALSPGKKSRDSLRSQTRGEN